MAIPDITSGFNTNPIAAMPSLHTAFPVLASLILWKLFRWKALPFIVYTLVVLFTIIYTSDHYIVDILAGAGLALLCYLLAFKIREKDKTAQAAGNTKKIFITGIVLLATGISVGMYNKHEFVSFPDHYDLRYAPTYIDFFNHEPAYEQNYKVQMYFGSYYFLRKDYEKALHYYEQARKATDQFVDERLAELRIKQTQTLLNRNR
jgi:hypothetical protein